jgi:hypothetical protein
METHEAHALCRQHMHRYVSAQMADGQVFDGIVESMDDDYLYLAVPIGAMETEDSRQLLYPGIGYPGGYPYSPYYSPYYSPFYPRRFNRFALPLFALLALSLLPYY